MVSELRLYSNSTDEIPRFLNLFYLQDISLENPLFWEKNFSNPLEMADLIAAFVDNRDLFFQTNMWVNIDVGVFINIKEDNYNYFIQYLFERYPY